MTNDLRRYAMFALGGIPGGFVWFAMEQVGAPEWIGFWVGLFVTMTMGEFFSRRAGKHKEESQ